MSVTVSPPPQRNDPALHGLSKQLDSAGTMMQREKGARLLLSAWPWLGGLAVVMVALDVIFHPGGGLRFALGIGFLAVAAGFIIAAVIVAARRRSHEHVARVLQDRAPHLGTKLLNALQLRSQSTDEKVSPLTRMGNGVMGNGVRREKRTHSTGVLIEDSGEMERSIRIN